MPDNPATASSPAPHRRRPRYRGTHPRRFEEKYKEHAPGQYPETVAKVMASGKTPAGTHRPIMVAEVLAALTPRPGDVAVDCTLGYGGHTQEILARIQPGGKLLALDVDPIELPRAEVRLRALGFGPGILTAYRSNFAGLAQILAQAGLSGADLILADLGVSSMQLDDPSRGFSTRRDGPLDLRMNPNRGQPASGLLQRITPEALSLLLSENADEPHATRLAPALAGKTFNTTKSLASAILSALNRTGKENADLTIRRVFQALRIAVNGEFSALDTFLRNLPVCLNPGGRVAILTFHSGEDRRVKKSFEGGLRDNNYAAISQEIIRPSPEERRANPRSTSAKLRWARRAA